MKVILEKLNRCNDKCRSVTLGRDKGVIPRWIGGNLKNPDLMVVGLNPGKCDTTERFLYKEFMNGDASLIHRFTNHCLLDPGSSKSNYLVRLTGFLKEVFSENDFLEKVYITNLVKCESDINGVVDSETQAHCFEKFLREEIALLKPKAILALGKEVYRLLQDRGVKNVVICPHPSPANARASNFWVTGSSERSAVIKTVKEMLTV